MRHSRSVCCACLVGAVLASGCSVIASLDGWTFGDEDAGTTDAGSMDAGHLDGGPQDAGPRDDAPACASPLTPCAGECVDLDSSSEHCGACGNTCPAPPHTAALCSSGACGVECSEGFVDCNGAPGDGCEADIENDPLHCGGCAMACETALSCREGACRPRLLWARTFGDVSIDRVRGIALDPEGNVYITGWFEGTIDLGDDSLTAQGYWDVLVASYTASGEHRWSRRVGGTAIDFGHAIVFDGSGSVPKVHVTGQFHDSASFGGASLTSNGGGDMFIATFDAADGSSLGSRSWGGSGNEYGYGIAVDPVGNIYVAGEFAGSNVDFGGTGRILTSAGGRDVFVASYPPAYASPPSTARWAKSFGSTSTDAAYGIAVDAGGNVYVTGGFAREVSFGGTVLASAGSGDAFVASFNSLGAHQWSTRGGGTADDGGYGIALDAESNVYVTGYSRGAASFGGDPLANAGSYDIFLASYGPGGAHRWSRGPGGSEHDAGHDISASPSGEVFSTGRFGSTVDFGGGTLTSGAEAGFVAAHEGTNGAPSASFAIGGPDGAAYGWSVAAADGLLCVGGEFHGIVTLGDRTLIAVGGPDGLIACFAP